MKIIVAQRYHEENMPPPVAHIKQNSLYSEWYIDSEDINIDQLVIIMSALGLPSLYLDMKGSTLYMTNNTESWT